MKNNKIFDTIQDKIQNIKRKKQKPGAIVVSYDLYYEIQNGYYEDDGSSYPFFPDFSQMQEKRFDKLFGLPVSTIRTTNQDYIEVYAL